MQDEIRQKLQAQFETPQLQKMVKEAASVQTGAVLRPLIQQEVSSDVAKRVKDEQQTINSTLVSETHKAVDNLKPDIDSIVSTRVNATVDKSVDNQISTKVQPVLSSLQQKEGLSDLLIRAQTGDGVAFDQLSFYAARFPSPRPEIQQSIVRAVRDIIRQHNQAVRSSLTFIKPQTDEQMLQYLHDSESGNREAAIDNLKEAALRSHADDLFRIMTSDPELSVREAAFIRFKQLRGDNDPEHNIQNLDNYTVSQWWSKHRQEFIENKKP